MSGSQNQQFPNRQTVWVDPQTGIMNPVSHALLHSLWARTGSGTASSTQPQMQADINANTAAIAAIPATYAPLASPHLTGVPTAPTPGAGDASTKLATTAFVSSGFLASATQLTASLAADVALTNTAVIFNGPRVAQGAAGTWFAAGAVTLTDTAGGATFLVYLWDGATVSASGVAQIPAAGNWVCVGLSGIIPNPVGDIRISVVDITSVNGKILFNQSGVSKDSTVSVFRVA